MNDTKVSASWGESVNLSELETIEKSLEVTRVTKVTEGGRILRFRSLVIVGTPNCDDKGDTYLGFATSNGLEVSDASAKAGRKAKKRVKKYNLYDRRTLHHDVYAKFKSTKIIIRKAVAGKGIKASPKAREILEAMGIKDAVVKVYGSRNPINLVHAIGNALATMHSKEYILKARKSGHKEN